MVLKENRLFTMILLVVVSDVISFLVLLQLLSTIQIVPYFRARSMALALLVLLCGLISRRFHKH